MANRNKNYRNLIKREHINAAMEEYVSRGGSSRKTGRSAKNIPKKALDSFESEDTIVDDFYGIEDSNDVPFSKYNRSTDYE